MNKKETVLIGIQYFFMIFILIIVFIGGINILNKLEKIKTEVPKTDVIIEIPKDENKVITYESYLKSEFTLKIVLKEKRNGSEIFEIKGDNIEHFYIYENGILEIKIKYNGNTIIFKDYISFEFY